MSENQAKPKGKKSVLGTVVSTKMQNTIAVLVEKQIQDKQYKKFITRSKKILAHVPNDMQCQEGDYVKIEECAPISKRKSAVLTAIVKKAEEIHS